MIYLIKAGRLKAMKDYLTVKEFAAAAGVSTQYIYKIIKKQLQQYVIKENGKTKIKATALSEFENLQQVSQPSLQQVSQPNFSSDLKENREMIQPSLQQVSQPSLQPKVEDVNSGEIAALNRLIDELKQDKETLLQQLDRQNQMIDTLNDRIAADGRRLENMQLLLDQQQKLTLVDKIAAAPAEEQQHEEQPLQEIKKNKGFFARLFNK